MVNVVEVAGVTVDDVVAFDVVVFGYYGIASNVDDHDDVTYVVGDVVICIVYNIVTHAYII